MVRQIVTRSSDGKTLDIAKEEAQQADVDARARRVTLTDGAGDKISSTNPLPVDSLNSLIPIGYDYIDPSYPNSVTEVYIFKSGGVGGTALGTITIVYADSSKKEFISVART